MGGWRRAAFATAQCEDDLEGAVADGRARGEGGEGGWAMQCTTRLCAARGAAAAAAVGRQARQAALAWMRYCGSAV